MIPLTKNAIFHNGGLSCDYTKKFPEMMKDEMFCLIFYMLAVHFFVSDDYLGRNNIKNRFISNLKTPRLNCVASSFRQRSNLHINDFETTTS